MSIPEGQIINTAYYDSVVDRIKSCGTCEDIQAALNDATGSVAAQQAALTAKLAALQPYMALASPPGANPAQIVTWITDFIKAQIEPMIKPTVTIPLQLAQLGALPAKFASAAAEAKARLPNCSISAPSFAPAKINLETMKKEGL